MKDLRDYSIVLLRLHFDLRCRSIPRLASTNLYKHFLIFLQSLYLIFWEHRGLYPSFRSPQSFIGGELFVTLVSMSQSEFLSLTAVCPIPAISRQCGTNDVFVYSCSSLVRIRETLIVLAQVAVAGESFVCPQEIPSGIAHSI